MTAPHVSGSPGKPEARKTSRAIAGVTIMLLGVALIGYGAHFLALNGNCSSTGYVSYGPVPTCHGPEALYITSVFFLGPALAIAGWLLARAWGLLWPAVCLSMAAAMITIRYDTQVSHGARAFALIIGICFAALAVVSVVVSVRKRHRRKAASAGAAHALAPGAPGESELRVR